MAALVWIAENCAQRRVLIERASQLETSAQAETDSRWMLIWSTVCLCFVFRTELLHCCAHSSQVTICLSKMD